MPFCEDTTGTFVTAWGSSEPDVGSDGKSYDDPSVHHRATATRNERGYVLDGAKSSFVSNGSIADAFVMFACTDESKGLRGSGAFVVPGDAPGVGRKPARSLPVPSRVRFVLHLSDAATPRVVH